MTGVDTITIRMRLGLWHGIDGGMDNKATNARWEYWEGGGAIGDPANPDVGRVSRFAEAIREAGWRQLADDWQGPSSNVITVTLTREQWDFILADASDSLPVYQDLARTAVGQSLREMLDSAMICSEAISVVGRALDA